MKIALVASYLNQYGGAERVLEVAHELFPNAPVFTSAFWPPAFPATYQTWDIRTSFLNRVPVRNQRLFLPLYLPHLSHLICRVRYADQHHERVRARRARAARRTAYLLLPDTSAISLDVRRLRRTRTDWSIAATHLAAVYPPIARMGSPHGGSRDASTLRFRKSCANALRNIISAIRQSFIRRSMCNVFKFPALTMITF